TTDKKLEKDALIVPSEAIVTSEEEDFVYIVEDDKAKQIKVDIVESQTKETAIKGEVSEEDNVVNNGQSLLSDHVEVNVKNDGNKKSQKKETSIKGEVSEEDNVVINCQSLLSDDVEVDVKKDGDES